MELSIGLCYNGFVERETKETLDLGVKANMTSSVDLLPGSKGYFHIAV